MTRFGQALILVLPAWQRLRDLSLPLWGFVRRRSRLQRLEALRAERRCRSCQARDRCRGRIVRRAAHPVVGCPNTMLLAMH
jgi:hypothetical protein